MRPRRRPGYASKAVNALHDAPASLCPHCGRTTKTTSDGICADCWGSKGGRMGHVPDPPTGFARFLLRLLGPRRRSS